MNSEPTGSSLRNRVLKGALWLIATRWAHRLVGLVSTMVLARVLSPDDFGLVAGVMAVVAILDGFFDFGFDLALIRQQNAERKEYDTVWTMRLIKASAFGLVLMAVSPLIEAYAHDSAMVPISIAIGIGLIVRGFENIGTVQFEKNLRYDRLFTIRLYPRLAGAATTIALAFALRSYWAIVLGPMLQNLYQVLFSYVLCDYRPRFRLQGVGAIWNFSKWILLSNISRQIFGSLDRFLLSGWIAKRELGYYTVSASVASMITNELVGAVGTALIPGYAKLQDDRQRLRAAFLMSQAAFVSLLLPASIGAVVLSPQLTAVILGPQWSDASGWLAAFAVFYVAYSIVENLNRFMAMSDLQMISARISLVRTTLFVILAYPAFKLGGLTLLVATKIALSSIEVVYIARQCCRRLDCGVGRYLAIYWRPALASAFMAACLWLLDRVLHGSDLIHLLAGAAVGCIAYGACALLLWRFSGRPAGLETLAADLLVRKGLLGRRGA